VAAELSSSKLEAVVSTGFCGALDPSLRECQIVLATSLVREDGSGAAECAMIHASPEGFATGPIASVDRIVGSASDKLAVAQRSGAIAVDMEASGVMERTLRAGLPFYCVKVVTDRADESFAFDLNKMRTSEGRIGRGKIVAYTLSHPNVLPRVMQLKRRAENAAKALGDFLVSCRILPDSGSTVTAE
jgi:adenosylhomocysteine nucleosidase